MEKYIAQALFVIGLAVWIGWVIVRRYLAVDFKEAEHAGQPPSDAQIKWYIREMRQIGRASCRERVYVLV